MSMKLGASSGTYNVRASELARNKPVTKSVRCVVRFLDDSEAIFEIDKRDKAHVLLQKVFEHLELMEKEYFGLQFVDNASGSQGMRYFQHQSHGPNEPVITSDVMRWLDPLKTIKKQIKALPYHLQFRVKFYVSDPSKLQEEYTRYHFFLQLKKDILEGKLVVPYKSAALLASYAVQSELGDYNLDDHTPGYLSECRFVTNQSEDFERDVSQLHKQHRGLTPAACEMLYLDQVRQVDTYGMDMYMASWVRDQSNLEIQLGVTSTGLVVFQNNARINTFSWSKIIKISFKRKQFFIQLRKEMNDNVENLVGFNMFSYRSCKNLWRSCIEHHTFFRLHTPPQVKGSFFSVRAKFRYSGKTQFQAVEEGKRRARIERSFDRSPSKRYARRTVGATTRSAILEERNAIDGHRNTPHSNSVENFRRPIVDNPSTPAHSINGCANQTGVPNSTSYPNSLRKCADTFFHSTVRATLPNDYKPNNFRVGSRNSMATVPIGAAVDSRQNQPPGGTCGNRQSPVRTVDGARPAIDHRLSRSAENCLDQRNAVTRNDAAAPVRVHQNDVKGHGSFNKKAPRLKDQPNGKTTMRKSSDDEGGFLERKPSSAAATTIATIKEKEPSAVIHPSLPPKMIGYMDDDSVTEQSFELPAYNNELLPNGSVFNDGHGLVTIRMKPDSQGRFGFNVKGGADQGMPIIVSRVAPQTPADLCIPRLNEGDQVLYINGRDVSQHTHEQVVMFIRSSRETHSGELVLVVRPNVYIGEDTPEEPDFQYIPDTHQAPLPPGGDPLSGSMALLQETLENGNLLAQFEQVYRKKPGMTMDGARLTENLAKNRYKDISPYDTTRVKIKSSGGDYINANFVNMEIQGSGIINRYIAAQGPLPNTCADFWQMIWEQQCTVVVMLTTKVERGRVKCHQYWPDLYETADFGCLQLTCLKEQLTSSFAFREFTLVSMEHGSEERHIRQMQYISWPDHGVPDDSSDFLQFVMRVRQNRIGMVEPTTVHCSAGIGRTGVLITMETAMCLIEANQPIYPLDVVRKMRDQRAMLIQTASQFKFVCDAVLRVYNEKIVQPLDDYKR